MVNGFAESWAAALGTGGIFVDGLQIWPSAKLYFSFFKFCYLCRVPDLMAVGKEAPLDRHANT
jgi:hypothetical protein